MKRIGLFGGSFNPVHLGHMAMASLACDSFGLEKMLFIPSAEHPFAKKTLLVSAVQRAEMVECAVAGEERFSCYRGELERTGVSYAVDTILEIEKLYPDYELFYLIGADNLKDFNKWYRYEEILKKVVLAVAMRPGYSVENQQKLSGDVRFFPSPDWGLSSTTLRDYLSKGLSCRYLLHDSVLNYISKNKIYG